MCLEDTHLPFTTTPVRTNSVNVWICGWSTGSLETSVDSVWQLTREPDTFQVTYSESAPQWVSLHVSLLSQINPQQAGELLRRCRSSSCFYRVEGSTPELQDRAAGLWFPPCIWHGVFTTEVVLSIWDPLGFSVLLISVKRMQRGRARVKLFVEESGALSRVRVDSSQVYCCDNVHVKDFYSFWSSQIALLEGHFPVQMIGRLIWWLLWGDRVGMMVSPCSDQKASSKIVISEDLDVYLLMAF